MVACKQFCTFYVDGLYCGIEVALVQEVIRDQVLTPVPLAPRVIRGLINLRGQIVTAIDLRRRLELPDQPAGGPPSMNVILRADEGLVSLLVDEIGDVIEIAGETFDAVPTTLNAVTRQLIRGAFLLTARLLLVLDVDRVMAIEHVNESETEKEAEYRR